MPRVFIPPSLRSLTQGVDVVDVEGTNVKELIDALDRQFPGIRTRLCVDEHLRPGLAVAVGSRISDRGLFTRIPTGEEVHFVQSVGGG